MALKPALTVSDPSLSAALASVDADRVPMPNEGMRAISAICAQSQGLAMAAMSFRPSGLGNIVSGAPVMYPAAQSISKANGAALAGLAALGATLAAGKSDGKSSLPKAPTSKAGGGTVDHAKPVESGKAGQKDKKEEPKKAEVKKDEKPKKTDPNIYSGFEEPELGKGTTITLGSGADTKAKPTAPAAKPVPPKPAVVTPPPTATTASTVATPPPPPPVTTGGFTSSVGPDGLLVLTPKT